VGIVVLKRLEDALADGDAVHAVIKGAAINNDGSFKAGYTAPSVEGQAKVIRTAQLLAEVHPETITYVETHGSATALGDPIEIAALTQAFRADTQKTGFCAIGSVKTNIGHTDASAGIAGLIKTILMLKNKMLPPSLHFNKPNPEIDFAKSPFYVNTRLAAWNVDAVPRRAGVSSFGIGGTNAHVIVEEAPAREASGNSRPYSLLLLSAKTRGALDDSTKNLVEHMKQHPHLDLADIAFTLQVGRQAFNHQRMAVCRDIPEAIDVLESLHADRVVTSFQEPGRREIVFLFSGQGSQYVNMGLELYKNEPVFRQEIDNASKILLPLLAVDLRDILYPEEQAKEQAAQMLTQTGITQPALFTLEYALAKLWMSWGVVPTALVGHSIGEYTAACLAGVFSLHEALTLVAARGRLMQGLPSGSMLAVPLPEKDVRPFLGKNLSLAVINGPSLCVVSGERPYVEDCKEQLAKINIEGKYLQTSHAFHSAMMEPILDMFVEKFSSIDLKPPQIPIVSNVTGTWITTDEATDPRYWARHLRQTVRFSDCLTALLEKPGRIFLEVGPGQTFKVLLNQQPDKSQAHAVLSSIRHPKERKSDMAFILNTLGQICLAGTRIDWAGFYQEARRLRLPLPTYPFDRKRYWISAPKEQPGEPSLAEALPEHNVRLEGLPPEKKSGPVPDRTSQDDIRSRIVDIWKETLGIDQVNSDDDFLALGGNSLIALRMLSQIEKVFGKQLPLSIFKSPTVGQLVSFIQSEEPARL
jgi:acyl transferase domain-containing protein